jgi:phage tail sheath protein FI
MVQVSYPGVYIQEVPSGVRTITGVATSIAAFIDALPRGLLNEAVQCLSFADFEREFGGIDANSPASYGIKQFFQNGGGECWVVRVASDGTVPNTTAALTATVTIKETAAVTSADVFRVQAGRQIRGASALNPGVWGNNLFIDVDYDTVDPESLFNLIVTEVRTENGRRTVLGTETFRNLTMEPGAPTNALDVVNAGSRMVQLDRDDFDPLEPPFPRPAASGSFGEPVGTLPTTEIKFTVDAGGGAREVTVPAGAADYPGLRPLLEQAIRSAATLAASDDERALIAGASVRLIGRGTTESPFHLLILAGRGGTNYDPAKKLEIGGADDATVLGFPPPPAPPTANKQQYQLIDGNDGTVPVGAAALTGNALAKTGMYALEDVDLFNLLCIPRAADLTDAVQMRAVYEEATTYVTERRAVLFIDIPEATNTLEAMQTWMAQNDALRSTNTAVYFPRTFVPDPVNLNRLKSIAASGTIAGLCARTDATRGVWKAPAGIDAALQNVQALGYPLTDLENGALNPLGINCLRTFPVFGHVSWGARTLVGADALGSEWKYLPIRRLALFLEESLYRGTKFAVFEPNDKGLYAQIRLNLGVFMNGLFKQGAFQGSTPQEAYFVKCDDETTTQADRNLGIVNIVVGFAPLKPAEFVVITIKQIAGNLL